MNKKVLIIIANYNSSEYIGDCLSSLQKIAYQKENFKALIVDDNSTDNSLEIIKNSYSEVEVVKNKNNMGFAKSNNIGMLYALENNFDYVYLLNQDTEVKPNFLEEALLIAESEGSISAVQSKLMLFENKNLINSVGNEIHYLGFAFAGGYKVTDYLMQPREITYPSGASVLIKTSALKKIGFFNEEFFMYHEDADLGWRLWMAGYKVMLAPDSVVYHKYEFSRSIKKYYYMERNRHLIVLQNYKLLTLVLILPMKILMDIAMLFYSFIGGWYKQEFKAFFYFLNLKNWHKLFKTRKYIQKNRQVGDREIIKRFVGTIDFQDIQNPLVKYIVNPVLNIYWKIIRHLIRW